MMGLCASRRKEQATPSAHQSRNAPATTGATFATTASTPASLGWMPSGSISAEQLDQFDDVELIVTYGDQELVDTLKSDPLLSQMPAVKNDAIVFLDGSGPMGTAANPTPLAISWVLDDYVAQLAEAVGNRE